MRANFAKLYPRFSSIVSSSLVAFACTHANAALQGRDLDGSSANGFEAYYDTVLNITWLADANYAKTSGYDTDGAMTWEKSMAWAESLSYFGVTGWRLPHFEPVNGVKIVDYPSNNQGQADVGYNITSPANELAYMYYVNLGLGGTVRYDNSIDFSAGVNANGEQPIADSSGSFIHHLKANMYWTNVVNVDAQKAWGLWTMFPVAGAHGFDYRYNDHYAWAVHAGDPFKVNVVPDITPTPSVDEPATAWLLLAGLGVALHASRRGKGIRQMGACVA